MTPFDYLMIAYSVIQGLAITELLAGFGNLLRNRRTTRISWSHLLWVFTLFVLNIHVWFGVWGLRELQMGIWLFALLLIGPTIRFLLAFLAFPTFETEHTDLVEWFDANRRPFFTLYALAPLHGLVFVVVAGLTPALDGQNGFRAAQAVLLLGAGFTKKRAVVFALGCVYLISVLVYIAFYRSQLS